MYIHNKNAAAPVEGGHKKNEAFAIGALLADMNHDIRTSMNGVRGMLELLLDTGLTPSQQEYARMARHNADELLKSLDRIVDMSLIETNSFHFNNAPFDLLHEVQAALSGKESIGRDKGVTLSIAYPPSVRLHGDGSRLRAAISALGDLALRSVAGERLSLAATARYLGEGLCRVMLEATIPQLSQDGGSLASMMKGNIPAQEAVEGKDMLSMAVCLRLVQMMKGTIEIDRGSPPATVFRLSVDLALVGDAMAGTRALILSERAGHWESKLAPLSRLGLEVDVFESALNCLAAIESAARNGAPYQLILLGHTVQGMNAGVLCSAIQANPAHRNTCLVLLADTFSTEVPSGLETGFSAILPASSNPAEVESALVSLCTFSARSLPASTTNAVSAERLDGISPSYTGATVLVADDNPVNQQVAARMLEKLGCSTEVAADGMQAIEMHTWKRFDLILMDCEMPVLDGMEATQRIRAAEGTNSRTPIIAVTASTGQGEQERCLAAGMDDFLSKPIRPQMLADLLARWLPRPTVACSVNRVPACEDELEEVKDMFGADFAELASLYQTDGTPRLAAMREAAAAGDCAKLAKVAHAMSGSSTSIGATGLSALCKTVETAAKAGSLEDFDKRMTAIDIEYRRVCDKLHSLLTP